MTTNCHVGPPDPDAGPSAEDLAALVDEEPLIAAGITLVDAEIRYLAVPAPSTVDAVLSAREHLAREERALADLRVRRAAFRLLAGRADQIPPAAGWDGPEGDEAVLAYPDLREAA